jgi:DNA mismatch repair protein MutL
MKINAPIRLLDSQTADRIAAGEVVERPASVVKELVENALDAGATAVTVDIDDGGAARIRVTDNGSGIAQQDVRLAFERHATSKIASGDDLTHIATLGFRGEALPSIAAVARVRLTTRAAGADAGVAIRVSGGRIEDVRPAGCPQGTTVIVEDLFFNTPARRKFLRKASTETGHIADALMALALSRPFLSLRFSQDGRTVFQTAGDGKLKSVAYTLFGPRAAAEMLEVSGQSGYVKVSGLVGVGMATRAGRDYEFTFVGGRVVRAAPIYQGIESALRERVMIGKCPICAVNVEVPDACVDVNCHPAKTQVRFTDEGYVRQAVYDVIAQCIAPVSSRSVMADLAGAPASGDAPGRAEPEKTPTQAHTPAVQEQQAMSEKSQEPALPPVQAPTPRDGGALSAQDSGQGDALKFEPANKAPLPETGRALTPEQPRETADVRQMGTKMEMQRPLGAFPSFSGVLKVAQGGGPASPYAAPKAQTAAQIQAEPEQLTLAQPQKEPGYTVMGQVFDTYLFLKTEKTVVIIDQHAAHERILYDRFMALCGTDEMAQTLLIPMVFDVTLRDKQRILDSAQELAQTGFTVEEFGPSQVRVVSVPVILGQPQVKSFFDELVMELDDLGTMKSADLRRARIIKMACRKAIKGGDPLTREEIDALLKLLEQSDSPPTCPHGRPIFIQIDEKELQKRFKRIV